VSRTCFPHSLARNPIPSAKPTAQSRTTMLPSLSNHEDRPICLRPISEDGRHLVVTIEDRFDDAQL
jgi:hypothetical protein